MHEAIAEQAEELEKLEQGCLEVETRLEGLEAQESEHRAKVDQSAAECDALRTRLEEGRCFSKAEVFRLQGEGANVFAKAASADLILRAAEYDALQHLNGWQLLHFDKTTVQLRHLDEFDVTLRLGPGRVEVATFSLSPSRKMSPLEAEVTRFLFDKIAINVQSLLAESTGPSRRAKVCYPRLDILRPAH